MRESTIVGGVHGTYFLNRLLDEYDPDDLAVGHGPPAMPEWARSGVEHVWADTPGATGSSQAAPDRRGQWHERRSRYRRGREHRRPGRPETRRRNPADASRPPNGRSRGRPAVGQLAAHRANPSRTAAGVPRQARNRPGGEEDGNDAPGALRGTRSQRRVGRDRFGRERGSDRKRRRPPAR